MENVKHGIERDGLMMNGNPIEFRNNLDGVSPACGERVPEREYRSVAGLPFKGGEFKFEHKLKPEETKLFRRLDSNFLKYELLTAFADGEEKSLLIKKGYDVLRLLKEIIGGC